MLERIAHKTGKEPAKLRELPDVEKYDFYIDAFSILSRSRSVGFGVGGIPLSEIEVYIRLYDVQDIERFIAVISAMDKAFMKAKPPKRGK